MAKEVKVTGCINCPMLKYINYYEDTSCCTAADLPTFDPTPTVAPDNCPLKTEPITVSLNEA